MDYYSDIRYDNEIPYMLIREDLNDLIIEIIIRNKIKSLVFVDNFNYPIDRIPECVEIIEFRGFYQGLFNYNLNNLPQSIKKIYMFSAYYQNGYSNLPENLEELYIENSNNTIINLNNLPANLKLLNINSPLHESFTFDHLPVNLKHLHIGYSCGLLQARLDNLPESLETLEINADFNFQIDNLPNNLKYLSIENISFNQSIYNLPKELQYLVISSKEFNQPIGNLPLNLIEVAINFGQNDIEINDLPDNLNNLFINACIDVSKNRKIKFNVAKLPSKMANIGFGILHDEIISQIPQINSSESKVKIFTINEY